MTTMTGARGTDLAIVWTMAGSVAAAQVTITPVGSTTPTIGPTATGLADCGAGRYTYVWSIPSGLSPGSYTAVLAGTVAGQPTTSTITVIVTGLPTYTTLDLVKTDLKMVDTGRDLLLQANLAAAARSVDDHCGRRFYRDASTSVRTWRTSRRCVPDADGELLLVDDIASIDGLVVETGDGTSWSTVDSGLIWAEPDNALADLRPITGLRLDLGCWSTSRRVRVTAAWGWPAVPDKVAEATRRWAARLFKRKDSPEGVSGSAEAGLIRVGRADPDVEALLSKYVHIGLG